MNSYAVIIEREYGRSYKDFHDSFVGHHSIKNWWHYLTSCYIIITHLDQNQLSNHCRESLKRFYYKETHLVLSVNLKEYQGWLPQDAWDWIDSNS